MKFPKALLDLQGKSFLQLVIDAHSDCTAALYVVLGYDHERIERSVDLSGTRVVINPDPSRGQLSSLQAALQELASAETIIVHPVDHPLVRQDTIRTLLEGSHSQPERILVPEYRGMKGHPVLFPSIFCQDLKQAPLEQGARWVVHRHQESVSRVPVDDPGVLRNIDTPDQYRSLTGG